MIAPIMLVAGKAIPSSIKDVSIVPSTPMINVVYDEQQHPAYASLHKFPLCKKARAKYTIAIPNTTHKNAGVIAITAENLKKTVIIPMMILATTAVPVQSILQPQFELDIKFHLRYII